MYTHSNKSSFGPLNDVTFGPIDNFVVLHGDLYVDLLSDSSSIVSFCVGDGVNLVNAIIGYKNREKNLI